MLESTTKQNKTISPRPAKTILLGKTLEELQLFAEQLGMPHYAGKQLSDWIYKKGIGSFEEMTNLSVKHRELLAARAEIGRTAPSKVVQSADGTRKYLFEVKDNHFIETVFIPDNDRNTLCVSSQIGCKMNCYFCMTGKQGFSGNLSTAQILNQLYAIVEREKITNIVFMGMGEPLDNTDEVLRAIACLTHPKGTAMSPRRITLSTVGVEKGLERFLSECDCHLAISLHSPISKERAAMMPVERAMPMEKMFHLLRKHNFSGQRRLTFEYIVFSGLNDSKHHLSALQRILKPFHCRLNLIRFHQIPGVDLPATDDGRMQKLCEWLNEKGINTTIRQSRGQDIEAACGMLSTLQTAKKE